MNFQGLIAQQIGCCAWQVLKQTIESVQKFNFLTIIILT